MNLEKKIQMVDLQSQQLRLSDELKEAVDSVLLDCSFINGPAVNSFVEELMKYLKVFGCIPCGNGTDAIRIALQAMDLKPGDEVIVPAFNYIAAAEMVSSLGLTPVWCDVDERTFNVKAANIESVVGDKTRGVIVTHLFGQSADMEPILQLCEEKKLFVIEDNAQSLGARYTFSDGKECLAGTMGLIGTTSFFPSKPLACYGDGGAIFTNDEALKERLYSIANHGQRQKYTHVYIGCNSRLDSLQAAILSVKLRHHEEFIKKRQDVAKRYDDAFASLRNVLIPKKIEQSTHVFHQYTVCLEEGKRDLVKQHLAKFGIPSMVYYPRAVHEQEAYKDKGVVRESLQIAEKLAHRVLSLPIHTEMDEKQQNYIIEHFIEAVNE